MLLADSATFTDFLNTNWGSIAAILGGVGTAISLAAAWVARVVWVRIETYWERHDKRQAITAEKSDTLIDTLTQHAPKHTELLTTIVDGIEESRKRDSDIVREIAKTKDAAGEISAGIELIPAAVADPKMQPHLERSMRRAREKLGIQVRREDQP